MLSLIFKGWGMRNIAQFSAGIQDRKLVPGRNAIPVAKKLGKLKQMKQDQKVAIFSATKAARWHGKTANSELARITHYGEVVAELIVSVS